MKLNELVKKILWNPWTALITLAIILTVRVADPSFVESIRLRYFDQLVTSQPAKDIPVSVVNIDEATLDKLGQFPFPRGDYADIIQDLYQHDAGLVVFNVLMPEKDRFKQDSVLGRTMQAFPTVLPAVAGQKNKNESHGSPVQVVGQDPNGKIVAYPGLLSNVEPQSSVAAGVGIVNTFPEIDGVVRRMPLVIMVGDELYPSLAMETLRVAAGDTRIQVKIGDVGVDALRVPKLDRINTDSLSRVWIDWSATPKEYSYTELPKSFNKGIVIVGLSAAGLANPVATARGEVWPQYLQAATLGTMLTGTTIQRPEWADRAELLALAVLSIVLLFLTRWTYVGLLSGIGIVGISIFGSRLLFSNYLFLFDATMVAGGTILVMLHAYGIKFVSEFLQKQQIKRQFGSYVNPTIVERLQKNPSLIKLGGERKELSIVMTDLRGFTTLGESFGDDVEGLTQIMNDYMTALSVPVLANDGTLIKFIGDASLHVHGAPLDDINHAKTAVRTAQQMIQAIADFNIELTAKGRPPVGMGAGVNTGETLIGNIGAKTKFGYDVLGDSVSTAARLEGQTKGYGVLLIIGPRTAELVKDEIPVVELDCIAVKGKTIGLKIYTPELETEEHKQFLDLYYRGQWLKAQLLIQSCVNANPRLTEYYHKMEERLKEGVPGNWNGTYYATSK